nr:hypothetical protein Iba_chr08cCG14950 [Ipomoea batatas]
MQARLKRERLLTREIGDAAQKGRGNEAAELGIFLKGWLNPSVFLPVISPFSTALLFYSEMGMMQIECYYSNIFRSCSSKEHRAEPQSKNPVDVDVCRPFLVGGHIFEPLSLFFIIGSRNEALQRIWNFGQPGLVCEYFHTQAGVCSHGSAKHFNPGIIGI